MESRLHHARSSNWTPLLGWVALFVMHRALVIAFAFDGVFFWEECYRLLIAEALRGGWSIPLADLQADPYAGGSLVFGSLVALVEPLVGSSIIVLKSVALAWSAAGFALWLAVTDRVFGRPAAHCLALVWLAAPPVFVAFNVFGLGFHGDTVTLAGLQMLLMYRWLGDPRRSGMGLFAWTAAAGFGVWFAYVAALPVAACVAYALLVGALPPRRWPLALAGFACGFSPWIAHAVAAGGSLAIVQQTFSGSAAAARGYFATLVDLTIHGVPAALYFRNIGIPGDVKVTRDFLSYPWLALFAAAWIGVVTSALRRGAAAAASVGDRGAATTVGAAASAFPEFPVVVMFPLFLVVIAASNQEFNDYGVVPWFTFRVLVPALPAAFVVIAVALARSGTLVRTLALVMLSIWGLVGSGQLLADRSDLMVAHESEARELGAEALGHLIVFKHGTAPAVAHERIDAIPAELRERAWRGVGFGYAYLFGTKRRDQPAANLTQMLQRLALRGSDWSACVEGARLAAGPGLAQVAPLAASPRRDEILAAIQAAVDAHPSQRLSESPTSRAGAER